MCHCTSGIPSDKTAKPDKDTLAENERAFFPVQVGAEDGSKDHLHNGDTNGSLDVKADRQQDRYQHHTAADPEKTCHGTNEGTYQNKFYNHTAAPNINVGL